MGAFRVAEMESSEVPFESALCRRDPFCRRLQTVKRKSDQSADLLQGADKVQEAQGAYQTVCKQGVSLPARGQQTVPPPDEGPLLSGPACFSCLVSAETLPESSERCHGQNLPASAGCVLGRGAHSLVGVEGALKCFRSGASIPRPRTALTQPSTRSATLGDVFAACSLAYQLPFV